MQNKFKIIGLFKNTPTQLSNGQMSSMPKIAVDTLSIKKSIILGDQVANEKYHGGDMRVIHHYSQKNYQHLKNKFPDIAHKFTPGSFGENILTEELDESELNIGDIYSLGTAKIQLTVCRRPCATINHAYQDDRILDEVIVSGHCGWFYRVLKEGVVHIGDNLSLLEMPFPKLPILKLHQQGYGTPRFSDYEYLKRCLSTGLMDKGWKGKLEGVIIT